MIVFKPSKMLDVPLSKGRIDPEAIRREFWPGVSPLGEKAGCYIFAVPQKYGRDGLLPIYVGRSARPLMLECFTSEKIAKLNNYLLHHPSTSLSLLLLSHPPNRQLLNRKAINDLEKSLIKMAVSVNPNLINKKNTRPDCWGIAGVIRGGRGRQSAGAKQLRALLDMDGEGKVRKPRAETAAGDDDAPIPSGAG
jgi:hypothetical protein